MNAFSKLSGAKNSFLITDKDRMSCFLSSLTNASRTSFIPIHSRGGESYIQPHHFSCFWNDMNYVAQLLCSTIKVDGFCYLSIDENKQVLWKFFNNDGSRVSMCGNASCAVVEYLYKRELIPKHTPFVQIQIEDNLIEGQFLDKQAVVKSDLPQIEEIDSPLKIGQKTLLISKVNSGVPHLLIEEKTLAHLDPFNKESLNELTSLACQIRQLEPQYNVTFYQQKEVGHIVKAVSFERGLEEFTLACGTGALAVSYLLFKKKQTHSQFKVIMLGGCLQTSFSKNKAFLQSPVTWDDDFFPYNESNLEVIKK